MYQNKKLHWWCQKLLFLGLLLVVFYSTGQWLSGVQTAALDPDEVVWVLDAEASTWYKLGDWSAFRLTKPFSQMTWTEHQYRVIDQPQLGKYLIGTQLSLSQLQPWNSSSKQKYYRQFMRQELPSGVPSELQEHFDESVITSISLMRWSSTFIALVAMTVAASALAVMVKNKIIGMLFFVFIANHEFVHHYYRLATASAYSFLAQVLAIVVMGIGLSKVRQSRQITFGWGGLAGLVVAAAASIKLDGLFLLVGPWIFWLLVLGRAHFFSLKLQKKYEVSLHYFFWWMVGFGLLFGVAFLLFEPEIFVNGFEGLVALLGSRLAQQDRFISDVADLSLLDRGLFLVTASWSQPWWVKGLLVAIMGWQVVQSKKQLPKINRAMLKKNIEQLDFFGQKFFVCLVLFGVMGGSLYASRVGFERYIIPAVVVVYILLLSWQSRYEKSDH